MNTHSTEWIYIRHFQGNLSKALDQNTSIRPNGVSFARVLLHSPIPEKFDAKSFVFIHSAEWGLYSIEWFLNHSFAT